jgi:hypothetical protein
MINEGPESGLARTGGFTSKELCVVIGMIAILSIIVANRLREPRPGVMVCVNDLKQIGLSWRIYAGDFNGRFPWESQSTEAPVREQDHPRGPAKYFLAAKGYLDTPRILVCPTDTRNIARNWAVLKNRNISYFMSTSVSSKMTNAMTIMAGDRNLELNGRPIGPGSIAFATNSALGWTRAMHTPIWGPAQGILLFTDGSVEMVPGRAAPGTWAAERFDRGGGGGPVDESFSGVVHRQVIPTNEILVP